MITGETRTTAPTAPCVSQPSWLVQINRWTLMLMSQRNQIHLLRGKIDGAKSNGCDDVCSTNDVFHNQVTSLKASRRGIEQRDCF